MLRSAQEAHQVVIGVLEPHPDPLFDDHEFNVQLLLEAYSILESVYAPYLVEQYLPGKVPTGEL